MDVFGKGLHVFDILHNCVDRSCVCQLSLNEYMMMMMMMMMRMSQKRRPKRAQSWSLHATMHICISQGSVATLYVNLWSDVQWAFESR